MGSAKLNGMGAPISGHSPPSESPGMGAPSSSAETSWRERLARLERHVEALERAVAQRRGPIRGGHAIMMHPNGEISDPWSNEWPEDWHVPEGFRVLPSDSNPTGWELVRKGDASRGPEDRE